MRDPFGFRADAHLALTRIGILAPFALIPIVLTPIQFIVEERIDSAAMTVLYPSTALHLAASAARIDKRIAADVAADPALFEGAAVLQAREAADRAAFRRFMLRVKLVDAD